MIGTTTGGSPQSDKILAFDMLKDSKFCITGLAKASIETSHVQLRELIDSTMAECIQDHYQLVDMLMIKGWYHPNNMIEQLQADMQMASQLQTKNAVQI